jgi:hypothetical protein
VLELHPLDLQEISFHGMVDSGGARLLDVDAFRAPCVCVYVCVCVCVYVYVCVCMCILVSVRARTWECLLLLLFVCVGMLICV